MRDFAIGLTFTVLAGFGAVDLMRRFCRAMARAARALDRRLASAGAWIAARWRAHAVAREKRRVSRENAKGAVQAHSTLVALELLAESQRELAALRALHAPRVASPEISRDRN